MPKGKPNIIVIWGDDTFTIDDAISMLRDASTAAAS